MKIDTSVSQYSKIVILANGEPPSHAIPVNILKNAEKLICCDGAISFLEQQNMHPHIIIGDCDSMIPAQKEKYKSIIRMDDCLEYNDLQKAIKYCIESGWENVVILGATGWRDDHFLANIGILMHYANKLSLKMVTNYGIFTPINCTTTLESYSGQQISVFSFSPEAEITFHGLKYSVHKQKFKELWEGSLNEALADNFTIELEKNATTLVYAAF
ncbi:MAG: thiamine diphosphokinase [Bacteroidetes bacterium]|nr:thiamine diphosphokinase [Bacteroidota bacterium]MCL2302567.1 thiamine diphosphokinase [Lentimicrobiaceae bacterium]